VPVLPRYITGRSPPILAAEQGGNLVSNTTGAFPDHPGIVEGLPGRDHSFALSRGHDKQSGMAFCDGVLLRHSVRDEVPRPKQADGIPREQAEVRMLLHKALELPHGLASPPHDRRRAFPAFLTPQALGGSGQLGDGVLQFGGVHHHPADGGHHLRIVMHDVLSLCTARSR
jgi:hypothetical protein